MMTPGDAGAPNGAARGARLDPSRVKVIACATVMEELAPRMPPEMPRQVLDFGLHTRPRTLTAALQAAIDASPGLDAVLLGYGLCSRAVIGLRATHCRLVMPRVDDCIAMFLGSRGAYRAQARGEPGTYYLTKGWIEAGDSPFEEVDRLAARYGAAKAEWLVRRMLRGYTRLAFIDTGPRDVEGHRERHRERHQERHRDRHRDPRPEPHRERARRSAERFGLRFEEIPGSPSLVEKLLRGPWDREILVVEPGDTVRDDAFAEVPDG